MYIVNCVTIVHVALGSCSSLALLPTGRLSCGFGIAMTSPPPQPGQYCSVICRNDPGGLQHFSFFWFGRGEGGGVGGGEGEVFVIASALKGSILKEDMAKSIFVQDCRPSPGADERLVFL